MITSLDTVVTAEEQKNTEFELLPKGDYIVKIVEIEPWSKRTLKNVTLKPSNEKVESVDIYNANVKMEVIEGEHTGRWLFDNLTTHPNMPWVVKGFIYAVGEENIKLSQIQRLEGSVCKVHVKIDSYEKKVTDKDTGLETTYTKEKNAIARYIKLDDEEYDRVFDTISEEMLEEI